MPRRLVLTLLVLPLVVPGCGGREEPPAPPPVVEAPPAPPALDPLDEALAKADVGEHRAALAALESLLPARAGDGALWAALEREAVAAGAAGELLDRLSASQAVGGERAQHFALRAALALTAGRPEAALEASAVLAGDDPGAAAALRARAVQAGAAAGDLDPAVPADALAIAVTGGDARKQKVALEAAAAVPGWRAALLRGELARAAGDGPAVEREVGIALADPDPRARLGALRLRLAAARDPAQVSSAAIEAAKAAAALHVGEEAADLLARAVAADVARSMPDTALQAARDLVSARPPGDDPVTARFAAALAEAALAAGEAEEALAASVRALAGEMREGPRRDAAWTRARGAWRLCDAAALEEAARALPDAEAGVARGLAAACDGDVALARSALQPAGLPPAAAVDVALAEALAWFGRPQAVEAARQAVQLADAGAPLVTRVEARLALERHARIAGQPQAAVAAVADLERIAPTGAVRMEGYARRLANGVPAALPEPTADEPSQAAVWRTFGDPTLLPTDGSEPPAVAAWAAGRRSLAGRDWAGAARMIRAAIVSLPVYRQGRWTPTLALDGADGPAFDADLRAALPGVGEGAEDVVLALHEWSHARSVARFGVMAGGDCMRGKDPAKATAFRAAWVREQARTLQWLAGTGPFPREQRGQTAQALAVAGRCERPVGIPPTAQEIRARFPETAAISIRLGEKDGEILVVTPRISRAVPLPDAAGIRRLAVAWRAALEAGRIATGQRTDIAPGDALRSATLDPFAEDLAGVPRYVLAVDPDLLLFSWSSLPEQSEGRRFLVDIRSVETVLRLGQAMAPAVPPADGYRPDFYGTGDEAQVTIVPPDEADAEAIALPAAEISTLGRLFGGGTSVMREGADATASDYLAQAGGARFVHIAGLGAAPDGGLAFSGSRVPLPVLHCTPLRAQLVTLTRPVDHLQQVARAQALLDAGARSVIVALWDVPQAFRVRYLAAMYDALGQERPPVQALIEARDVLRSDQALGPDAEDPSSWGAFLLLGVP